MVRLQSVVANESMNTKRYIAVMPCSWAEIIRHISDRNTITRSPAVYTCMRYCVLFRH